MEVHDASTLVTSAAAAAPNVGDRCGEWTLLAEIATGGFGKIFEATDAMSARRAAVKVLRRELAEPDAVLRFEREAALLSALAMPGFVDVFELGRLEDGRPFMVMELLDGHDLKWWLELKGRLTLSEALAILEPLCQVLGAAHARGIVHRDIKASNVFLTGSPRAPERVTVLDFGLAKLLDNSLSPLTASRQILGTPASMAPEQIVGGTVDERTDVYALGALTFQLLCAEPPFKDESVHVVCQMHLHARVPCLSARAPLGPELDPVIARAMSKRREDRYGSSAEFFAALSAAAESGLSKPATREVSVVLVSLALSAKPGLLERGGPQLLDGFEAIVPFAREELERAGMKIALRVSDLLLAYWELADEPERAREQRRSAIDLALDLNRRLRERTASSGLVTTITVTSGGAKAGPAGLVAGPELTPGPAVEHDEVRGAVLASEVTLAGLELRACVCEANPSLLRVLDSG
jgi:serine/threonine-protein kinase